MKPNIIILISDALRPKDLSIYGRPEVYDKFLHELSSESVLFKSNFSASNGSDPSNTALFSGKYPMTSGFIHQHPFMREDEVAKLKKNPFWLPLYLQQKGYRTVSATPLHMWFKKGFDSFTDKEGLKSGRFLDVPFMKRILLGLPNWAYRLGKSLVRVRASPQFYPCNKVMDFAINTLQENKPFFLFMHLVDTHYPYPIAQIKNIDGQTTLRKIVDRLESGKQREYVKKRFYDLHADNMEQIERKRDDSIIAVDNQIKRLCDSLKQKGLWDNTILIITADHGDTFGEHETYFCRGGLYDESVHVPLIIRLPGMKPRVVTSLTQNIDISATILDVLRERKYKLDGKSLIQTMKNGKRVRDRALFADAFCDNRLGARTESAKLVISDKGPCYLCGARHHKQVKESYDLEEDSEENTNVYPEYNELEKFIN